MTDNEFYIGVDVGSTECKVICINSNNKIIGKVKDYVKGNPENAVKNCLKELSILVVQKEGQLKKRSISTGQNGDKISIKNTASEISCIGAGVYTLNPGVRIAVDVGSFSMKALKMDEKGKIRDFLVNDKCAAGSGILLELVAEGLEMKVEELSDYALKGKNPIQISSQCSIFAESEVISYKNEGANIPDLVAGVCNSVAGRIYPLIRKLDKAPTTISFSGGVANCTKVIENLEERIGLKLASLPIEPQYITAFGAAITAKNGGNL